MAALFGITLYRGIVGNIVVCIVTLITVYCDCIAGTIF